MSPYFKMRVPHVRLFGHGRGAWDPSHVGSGKGPSGYAAWMNGSIG